MSLKSTNKVDTNRYKLEVFVDGDTFEKSLEKIFKKNSKKITIPGFRKGKAPRSFVEKYYGEKVFYEDAMNEAYPEALEDAIKKAGLETVDNNVNLDIKEVGKEGFLFTAEIVTKPEVSIDNYKGLEVNKKSVEVTDEDINSELDNARDKASRLVTVEGREAQKDDVVVIDFEGFIDGKEFEGGKAENYSLAIGSGQFIPGFEDQIIGHKLDEEFDIKVNFPEDYQATELKGKETVFKIKLHEIKTKELPELDDEFVKDISEFDTLDEYKGDLKNKISERKQKEVENDIDTQIIDKLIELLEAEIPDAMFEKRIDDDINQFELRLRSQGIDIGTYMQYTGMDKTAMREGFRSQAERQVKLRLALEKIAKLENFEILDKDIEDEYKKIAEQYKIETNKVKALINSDDLKKDIEVDRAMKFVKDQANIK